MAVHLANTQIVSVAQAARYFEVDQVTIRRWIKSGCPCHRSGRRGPGHGALLDLRRVEQWRGVSSAPMGMTADDTLQRIASALYESLIDDRAASRAGIDQADGAAVLIVAFERCCQEFGKTYPFDQQPEPIRTLMSFL